MHGVIANSLTKKRGPVIDGAPCKNFLLTQLILEPLKLVTVILYLGFFG